MLTYRKESSYIHVYIKDNYFWHSTLWWVATLTVTVVIYTHTFVPPIVSQPKNMLVIIYRLKLHVWDSPQFARRALEYSQNASGVVILLGSNDSKHSLWNESRFFADYTSMVRHFKKFESSRYQPAPIYLHKPICQTIFIDITDEYHWVMSVRLLYEPTRPLVYVVIPPPIYGEFPVKA